MQKKFEVNQTMPILAIVGPTCVGKTAYVRRLLELYPLEIINLDSFQVFDHFFVGTGRADGDFGVAGHLYGFVTPDTELSPVAYVAKAREIIRQIIERGNIPLFEGGSISYL